MFDKTTMNYLSPPETTKTKLTILHCFKNPVLWRDKYPVDPTEKAAETAPNPRKKPTCLTFLPKTKLSQTKPKKTSSTISSPPTNHNSSTRTLQSSSHRPNEKAIATT
jgi:hypothetical protein